MPAATLHPDGPVPPLAGGVRFGSDAVTEPESALSHLICR